MNQFENALEAFGNSALQAQKAADAAAKAVRTAISASRSGNVQQLEKALAQLPALGDAAAAALRDLPSTWQFDAKGYLQVGYLAELEAAAATAGVKLFERDGRIYAFPLILRLLPGDAAIRVAGKVDRNIRPSQIVDKLAALQKKPQRLNEQRFLDLLYRAYQKLAGSDWRKVQNGAGPAIVLAEIHETLTLLPGTDYPLEEFGRDLLLLDRQPELRVRDGSGYDFVGSTLSRSSKPITIYDEAGNSREYTAIIFAKGS